MTWYVTPADPAPPRYAEAPDDGAGEVDAPAVTAAIEGLLPLVPALAHGGERVEATVFGGYKQELDGQPTRRACEVVDDERNVVLALPSLLANAVPNAHDALTLLRGRLVASGAVPQAELGEPVAVGDLNENTQGTRWTNWSEFAHRYGVGLA